MASGFYVEKSTMKNFIISSKNYFKVVTIVDKHGVRTFKEKWNQLILMIMRAKDFVFLSSSL